MNRSRGHGFPGALLLPEYAPNLGCHGAGHDLLARVFDDQAALDLALTSHQMIANGNILPGAPT